MEKNVHTFIGCDNDYKDSKTVLFGAPFDSTASYRPGARFGPSAVRNESNAIETYSPYQNKDLNDITVFDGGDLETPFGNPTRPLQMIEEFASKIIQDKKTPFMIGGEHLMTLGAVRALIKKHPDLHILCFDAHADLRNDYLGETLSHATVMRRCFDLTGKDRIFQFGVRSGERDEFDFAKENTFIQKFNFNGLDGVLAQLKGKPIYFSIDLDVLDPSVLPGTGTPEAGGVSFDELLTAALKMSGLSIVGADAMELCPTCDPSGISTALACKLIREMLLML